MGFLYILAIDLPNLDDLVKPKYDLPTQLYDRNGELVTEYYTKRRVLIPFEKVPDIMVNALLAIEDNRFYSHIGIDPIRMVKALIVDIIKGEFAEGASTLTQQTARMFKLNTDKQVIRKLKEILLALKMESRFTKNQILELYLNKYYFGHGLYGIEAASQGYFSKTVEELNLAEAAMLAGLPQRPSRWAPTYSMANATRRRNMVLKRMDDLGYITTEERIKTTIMPIELNLNKSLDFNETSYYTEHVRRYIYDKYGQDQLYTGGLKVYTMMDLKMQIAAQNALHSGLIEHDRRQGYRGPKKNLYQEINQELALYIYSEEKGWNTEQFKALDEETQVVVKELFKEKILKETGENHFIIGGKVIGVVTNVNPRQTEVNLGEYQGNLLLNSMRWARPVNYEVEYYKEKLKNFHDILKVGDLIEMEILDYDHENQEFSLVLSQHPLANGGVFAMDPHNGHVLAIAGGFDFKESEFNRAIQGKRQTGSAFKPIAYSLALENGFTASAMLDDSPFVGENYKFRNYDEKFRGKMSLREALVHSKNMPSLRLAKELGTDKIIEHARTLGITAKIPEDDLTIILGSASITLEEMTVAFATFANSGYLPKPVFVSRIEDRNGNVLEEYVEPKFEQVLSEETSFLMSSMLQDVVKQGSGRRALALQRPSAGKTGTSNNYTNGWYIGFIPQLITGVYVGFDKNMQSLGEKEGGPRTAAPIWTEFMKEATATMPILPFEQPDGITMVKINTDTGQLDCDSGGKTKYEYYKAGTEPTQCHQMIAEPLKNEGGDSTNENKPATEVEEL